MGGKKMKEPKPTPVAQKRWRPRQKPAGDGGEEGEAAASSGSGGRTPPVAAPGRAVSRIDSSFIPPGCDEGEGGHPTRCYEDSLVRGFWCPPRLHGRNESLVEAVNDWHYAMLNDTHRNDFYWDAMEGLVRGRRVVDIGAGSGLLSLMAAKQGASKVVAIEASRDMVDLARINIERNGESGKIRVIHSLSNNVVLEDDERADVIVSETLGALMLGEGMLDYLADARERLAKPGAAVVPAGGAQYAMLISSPSLAMVSSVQPQCCKGFDLSAIGSLQDTGNLFFTKQWGFRLNSLPDIVVMSDRICLLEVDFQSSERAHIPATKTFQLQARHAGVVHAVVASWEVWSDPEQRRHKITTHPEDTRDEPWGFARDMQWGQGMQLVEEFDAASRAERNATPAPFAVKAGEPLLLTVRFSVPCRQTFQFTLRRASGLRLK